MTDLAALAILAELGSGQLVEDDHDKHGRARSGLTPVDGRSALTLTIGPTDAAAPAGPRQFAASLRKLASRQDVDETLQRMVDLSIELIEGCDLADVVVVPLGRDHTRGHLPAGWSTRSLSARGR